MAERESDRLNCGKYAAGPNPAEPNAAEPNPAEPDTAVPNPAEPNPAGLKNRRENAAGADVAPGWERDENGNLRREKKPHMGRRLPGFDYSQRMIYEITIVLEERRPVLGRLVKVPREEAADSETNCAVEPSPFGQAVLDCWRKIPDFWPQVSLIEAQLMPDHFHGILFVKERLPLTHPDRPESPDNRRKTLGEIIRGFKVGCTMAWREVANRGNCGKYAAGPDTAGPDCSAPAHICAGNIPQWADDFVDTILFHNGQLAKMIAYLRDNPRRLGMKREHPELFKVVRDLEIPFASFSEGGHPIEPWHGPTSGHFVAIGNHFLLSRPRLVQVQCSREFLRYRRKYAAGPVNCGKYAAGTNAAGPNGKPSICRDASGKPIIEFSTPEFEAKLNEALSAARNGAVLVSPCISHGEREIARRAFEEGCRVVTLQNKGFSPLYKPGGKLFETCANGNLLMLAPINWPYQPAEKQMTRDDALVLNRIAQLISGDGAVVINYNGAVMSGIDASVAAAVN